MTDLLLERASALKDANFKMLKTVQQEMTELKNKKLEKLCTPNYMWVTFVQGEGQLACHGKQNFKFGSHEFRLKRAQNPSDFKFENVKMNKKRHKMRKNMSKCLVVLFGLAFFFVGVALIKRMQIIRFM